MRNLRMMCPLIAMLLSVPSARAQKGDWSAVENLQPGTRISVKTVVRLICYFESATDDGLVCSMHLRGPILMISRKSRYDRRRIREVRLEYSEATDAAVGAIVGAGAGAIVGAVAPSNGTITRGGSALLLGGIGALFGSQFGRDFPVVHGKVIYKR